MLDQVNNDHRPILIARQKGKPAVVMSLEDFKSYEETAYLMANPYNAVTIIDECGVGRMPGRVVCRCMPDYGGTALRSALH